jgi:L,D-peptidoglycan transpeptidase YkuD (ErfK/YbiS/YcfS/YnhG family)
MKRPPPICVHAVAGDRCRGVLQFGGLTVSCALGRSGLRQAKREGDGATPLGRWRLMSVLYRSDRMRRPSTRLPCRTLRPDDGWCDDPANRLYNRPVRLPYAGRHERLWREDGLYDVVVVLDYNLAPVHRGLGSAIFLHIAAPGFRPTEGCVAIKLDAMRKLLARVTPGATIAIG